MSRSRRKSPWIGLGADSDKSYKLREHRRERRLIRVVLHVTADGDDRRLYARQYGNTWMSNKDGKVPVDERGPWMRK